MRTVLCKNLLQTDWRKSLNKVMCIEAHETCRMEGNELDFPSLCALLKKDPIAIGVMIAAESDAFNEIMRSADGFAHIVKLIERGEAIQTEVRVSFRSNLDLVLELFFAFPPIQSIKFGIYRYFYD